VEYGIAKPSNKLLALAELDSNTWVSEVKRIGSKKQPLTSTGLHALRDEYARTIEPARALAAEALNLERTLSDLVNQAYALTRLRSSWCGISPRPACPSRHLPRRHQLKTQDSWFALELRQRGG
jgi:hypothetical protein